MKWKGDGKSGKGLIWKLMVVKSEHLAQLGPTVGFSARYGVGFSLSLMFDKQFLVFSS